MPDGAGDDLSDEEPDDRHQALEDAEGDAHSEPGPGIDAGESDSDGACEIAEADRGADQEEADESGQPASTSSVCSMVAAPAWLPIGPTSGSVVPAAR
ncbi:MAG: hypothetical protein NVS9B1_15540 [Candidatus Dormibacteraceae bacterium]